jgi:hypothetical protein
MEVDINLVGPSKYALASLHSCVLFYDFLIGNLISLRGLCFLVCIHNLIFSFIFFVRVSLDVVSVTSCIPSLSYVRLDVNLHYSWIRIC